MVHHHLVYLRLRADADAGAVMAALRGLVGVVPGLLSFAGGENTSPEGISRGFTHAFAMVFESAAARDGYLPHPAHVVVKDFIGERLDRSDRGGDAVAVMDFAGSD